MSTAPNGFEEALVILNAALAGLAKVGPISAIVSGVVTPQVQMALAFVSIIQAAQAAVIATTGQPIDLTKIPLETPVS